MSKAVKKNTFNNAIPISLISLYKIYKTMSVLNYKYWQNRPCQYSLSVFTDIIQGVMYLVKNIIKKYNYIQKKGDIKWTPISQMNNKV